MTNIVNNGIVFGAPNAFEKPIAEHICKRIPSIDKVRFTNSGTEAVMNALRLARAYTGKPKIAKFEGGFHGTTDDAEISISPPLDEAGADESPNAVAQYKGINQGIIDNIVVMPYNDPEAVDLILTENKEDVAAVIYDPKSGNYDIPHEFLRFVADKCKELGILFIMDEVKSLSVAYGGFQELAGVDPDITTLGKLVGGGMPVGAFGGKAHIMDMMSGNRGISSGGTYSGNPMTLAAGLAHMEGATPEVYVHLKQLGREAAAGVGGRVCPCQRAGSHHLHREHHERAHDVGPRAQLSRCCEVRPGHAASVDAGDVPGGALRPRASGDDHLRSYDQRDRRRLLGVVGEGAQRQGVVEF